MGRSHRFRTGPPGCSVAKPIAGSGCTGAERSRKRTQGSDHPEPSRTRGTPRLAADAFAAAIRSLPRCERNAMSKIRPQFHCFVLTNTSRGQPASSPGWAGFFAAYDPTPAIASLPSSGLRRGSSRRRFGTPRHGRSCLCLGRVRGAGGHDLPGARPVAEPVLASSGPIDSNPPITFPSRDPFLSTIWRPRGYATRARGPRPAG